MLRDPSSGEELTNTARRRLAALFLHAARADFWATRLKEARIDPQRVGAVDAFGALRRITPVTARELRLAGGGAIRDGWVRPWWRSATRAVPGPEPVQLWYDLGSWWLLSRRVRTRAQAACGISREDRVALLAPIRPVLEGWTPGEVLRRRQRVSSLQPPEAIARKLVLHHPKAIVGSGPELFVAARALAAAGWRAAGRGVGSRRRRTSHRRCRRAGGHRPRQPRDAPHPLPHRRPRLPGGRPLHLRLLASLDGHLRPA